MAWQLDPSHSEIHFSAKHLMISTVRGRFHKFTATIDADEQNPTAAKIDVQIEAASIDTRDEKRDGHLRSPDFLDVDQFPYLTFKSTRVERIDENHGKLVGDLTMHGVTREVTLDVTAEGRGKDPWGGERAGFTARTQIKRSDYGLTYNQALETGGFLVGDDIKISIDVELVKQ